ncbi:hypothetical protein VB737_04180 [Synechococcus sp. BA-120 BA3]|nr:hypothetical protein [Synechococcus sp. BA-120 BA3]
MAPFSAKHLLTRTLMAAALIGGGASLLSAGSAEAVQVFCNTNNSWEVGDKRISNILCNGFGTQNSFLRFAQSGITYDFGGLFDPLPTTPGSISYLLEVINPDPSVNFASVELDSDCDDVAGGSCNVSKDIFYNALGSRGNGDVSLLSANGEEAFAPITGRTIYVLDSWAPTGNAALSGIENAYTQASVPGPLPVLGAGVAFGFSRKLRRRIQGDRVKA